MPETPSRKPLAEWTYAELMAEPLCDDDCTWCDGILREVARRNIAQRAGVA